MKLLYLNILIILILAACSPARDYQHSEGLKFDKEDWTKDGRFERPYILNSEMSQDVKTGEEVLYLPAELFRNTSINTVYYEDKKSRNIQYNENGNPKFIVTFSPEHKMDEKSPYSLNKDEAVLDISTEGIDRTILIDDIRIPSKAQTP